MLPYRPMGLQPDIDPEREKIRRERAAAGSRRRWRAQRAAKIRASREAEQIQASKSRRPV